MTKTCYYELLNVSFKAEDDEIKKAFRRLAFKYHPDKARDLPPAEAKERFQQLQEAYETLSDPHERAWYDGHRAEILRGDEDDFDGEACGVVNIWPFFIRSCFDDFDDGPKGFYTIHAEDVRWTEREIAPKRPEFGTASSSWTEVSNFYKEWSDFASTVAFAHESKWKLSDAPNREIRKIMENENKKAQNQARREYNEKVRQLVEHVRRRDPRVVQRQVQKAKYLAEVKEIEKKKKDLEDELKRRAREKARQEEIDRREQRRAELASNMGNQAFNFLDEDHVEKQRKLFVCVWCNKSFKSQAQYDNHLTSKKHQQTMKAQDARQSEGRNQTHTRTSELKTAAKTQVDKPSTNMKSAQLTINTSGSSVLGSDKSDSDSPESESGSEEGDVDFSVFLKKNKKISEDAESIEFIQLSNDKVSDVRLGTNTKQKPRRRRQKTTSDQPDDPTCKEKCKICGMGFPSRTKLMNHIREKGHAALKK